MLNNLIQGSALQQSLFIMLVGISGVFLVLVLFFLMIKLLTKIFPEKGKNL
jgi:Na+-transporting methylmalonyl-CoA/oxaloacetate decarboxylase gamma subunit